MKGASVFGIVLLTLFLGCLGSTTELTLKLSPDEFLGETPAETSELVADFVAQLSDETGAKLEVKSISDPYIITSLKISGEELNDLELSLARMDGSLAKTEKISEDDEDVYVMTLKRGVYEEELEPFFEEYPSLEENLIELGGPNYNDEGTIDVVVSGFQKKETERYIQELKTSHPGIIVDVTEVIEEGE